VTPTANWVANACPFPVADDAVKFTVVGALVIVNRPGRSVMVAVAAFAGIVAQIVWLISERARSNERRANFIEIPPTGGIASRSSDMEGARQSDDR
jgi:hypothetical protein